MWLKRSTPQNIVIGGAAGAFPPMIGWAAATGRVGVESVLMFLHHLLLDAAAFLGAVAVAHAGLCARRNSDAAGGRRRAVETRRQILLYTLMLVPVGVAPWLFGYAGVLYGADRAVAGAIMLALGLA